MQKTTRIKIVLILFYAVVFLVFAEVILRISGRYKTYTEKIKGEYYCPYGIKLPYFHLHKPSTEFILDHTDFKYPYSINSLGIREGEIEKEKSSRKKRIFCFGDSFTEGVGAPYDSSYVKELGKKIKEKSKDFEIFNCAVSGSDPFFNFVLLKEKLIAYNPDIVFLTVNSSDLSDYIYLGGIERFINKEVVTRRKPFFEPFFCHSHFIRFIIIDLLKYDWTLLQVDDYNYLIDEAVKDISAIVGQTEDLCNSKGVKFMLILQPAPDEILFPEKNYKKILKLVPFLELNRINYIDLFPSISAVMNKNNIREYSWKTDGHYNSNGYKVLGDAIFTETEKKYHNFWNN